jgi:hypothetical protein
VGDPPSLEPPSFRQLGPRLLFAGVLPFVAYQVARPHVSSDAVGLLIAAVFPAADALVRAVRERQLDVIAIFVLLAIGLGVVGSVLFHGNALPLKVREVPLTGGLGIACLVSLLVRRPLIFTLGRGIVVGGDVAKAKDYNSLRDDPDAQRLFRRLTMMWGLGLLGEGVLRVSLALLLSTSTFLAVSPPLSGACYVGLFWATAMRVRRARAAGGQAPDAAAVVG